MSHITKCKTQVRNLESLRSAAARRGGELREGQRSFQAYTAKLPCDHAIHVAGARYEVGVIREGDGYALEFDSWSPGGLGQFLGGPNAEGLMREYAAEETRAWMAEQGHAFTEYEHDGELHFVAHVN